ncbi:hypothetical protein GCM10027052_21080 [Parafrigoribacterium mesophilum]|uniref:hypothetical protein n=1 Tax=Parafrigoribacterium mesophilum TaxID=433646 RepID=UPI0031FE21C2
MHKKILAAGSALLLLAGLMALGAGQASAGNDGQVCAGFDSGKIDVSGSHLALEVAAPAGQLIDGYCIKAGSVQQGLGPKWVDVNPPVASLTISYPTATKNISHYALSYTPSTASSTPPTTDACPDMPGPQSAGTVCVTMPPETDACPAMLGNQSAGTVCETVPPVGECSDTQMRDDAGHCVSLPPTLAVAGLVTTTDPTCAAPAQLVLGSGAFASWNEVVYSGDGNLHYSVTAAAHDGRLFSTGQATMTLTGDLAPALSASDPACVELSTHPLVTPTVTFENLGCSANGTYTLASAEGLDEGILWTVDGKAVTSGKHLVRSAGIVTVTAAPNAPTYGFSFDTQTTWALNFTDAQDCGDLTTLALPGDDSLASTGANANVINLSLLLAGGLLLLGGGLLLLRRALVITEKRFRLDKR